MRGWCLVRRDPWRRIVADVLWVAAAAVTMGTFIAVAHFADYGPAVSLDTGGTVIGIPLVTGIAMGVLLAHDEPQSLVLMGFISSLGAIAIVGLTLYAPVLAGVVPRLDELGTGELARLASLLTSLFIVPIHLVGNVIGYGLEEVFPSSAHGVRRWRF